MKSPIAKTPRQNANDLGEDERDAFLTPDSAIETDKSEKALPSGKAKKTLKKKKTKPAATPVRRSSRLQSKP